MTSAPAPAPADAAARVEQLLAPPTVVAARSRAVAAAHASAALVGHSERSWVLAAELGRREGVAFDPELLYAASLLHDLGLVASFDSHEVAFERAGGDVARVFAAGAGWDDDRQRRLGEVVVRHMWPAVSAELDAEGHLLERATSLDVSGVGGDDWEPAFVAALVERVPRTGFAAEFGVAIAAQAHRKPATEAGRAVRSGITRRLAENPLDRLGGVPLDRLGG
ncbi:HD domain-containing protein [Frigoribacterium sp. CFBP 13707]|uniref:HD domain-containing protein n=1 Tax=Frigoribacterium sp. CFBP 13707 TaxID=2775313 RepID=UPI00177BBE84|nr:HD domain-containing protein [Frigoribacterium sp. CFBP 13707]MBD8729194.1 HD domain-containing protein [Frigoribacterium sp. CFBP 13707]